MSASPLPPGYLAAAASVADAPEAAALIAAYEERFEGAARTTVESLTADWAGADLATDCVCVRAEGGGLVGLVDMVPSRRELLMTYAYVAEGVPEAVTAHLAAVAEARALRLSGGGRVVVRNYLPAADRGLANHLAGRGYREARTIYRMHMELPHAPTAPAWPDGVSVRDYRGDADEPATHEAFELGSSGMWGRPGNTLEQWLGHVRGQRPGAMRLAMAAGGIAGISVTRWPGEAGGEGVVNSLRVVPEWRRRGLGAALLADALCVLHARGARSASLTVDASSTTGAPELYLRAGMRPVKSYLALEREA